MEFEKGIKWIKRSERAKRMKVLSSRIQIMTRRRALMVFFVLWFILKDEEAFSFSRDSFRGFSFYINTHNTYFHGELNAYYQLYWRNFLRFFSTNLC